MSRSPIPIDDRLEAVPADDGSGALLRERGGGRSVVFLSSDHLRQLTGTATRPAAPRGDTAGDQQPAPTEASPAGASGAEPDPGAAPAPEPTAAPAKPTKPAKAGTKGARS